MYKEPDEFVNSTNEFREHYKAYLNGNNINGYVTQSFMQTLNLRKRRLDQNNIEMKINYDTFQKEAPEISVQNESAGRVFTVQSDIDIEKQYFRNGKEIGKNDDSVIEECVFIDSHQEDDTFICPKCGAKGNKSMFVGGCPYCGAKFKVDEFGTKVTGYQFKHNSKRDMKKIGKTCAKLAITSVALLILGLFTNFALMCTNNMTPLTVILYQVMQFLLGGAIVAVLISGAIFVFLKYLGDGFISMFFEDGKLDSERLQSALEYKITSIHFAENKQESSQFVMKDITDIIENYQDVIDCSVEHCYLRLVDSSEKYATADANVKLNVVLLKNNRIIKRKEYLNLRLRTLSSNIQEKTPGIICYTCPKCGSTIDILNGGVCQSCGYEMNLIDVDWVITDYQISGKKKFRKPRKWYRYVIGVAMVIAFVRNTASILVPIRVISGMADGKYEKAYVAMADVIPRLTKVYPDAVEKNVSLDHGRTARYAHVTDTYTYEDTDDNEKVAKDYVQYLKKHDGFDMVSSGDQRYVLQRKISFMSDSQTIITVSFEDELTIKVEMNE